MKHKILALSLAAALLTSTVSAAAVPSDFSDMPDNFATDSLIAAVENGLLSGDDGQIMPYDNLTRAQMATILVRAFGGENTEDMSAFTDVSSTAWYYENLSAAVAMGIFQGSGNQMNPDSAITRQEAFVVLARAFALGSGDTALLDAYVDGGDVATWAAADVAAMVATGYVKGNGTNLYPNDTITRQEFAVVMDRMVETYISEKGNYTELADGSVMVNTPDVTLSNMTINGDLIIGDGVGDGDITLDDVIVTGHMVVRGGGTNSVVAKGKTEIKGDVKIAKVTGAVRVAVEGDATVSTVSVSDGLENIIVEGAIENLVVDHGTTVYAVNATIEKVDVHAEEAIVVLKEGTSVSDATIYETATNAQIILEDKGTTAGTITTAAESSGVTVGENTKVESVVTTETANSATVEVAKDATVSKVESSAEGTTVKGDGTVENVAVSGNNTTVETEGTKVEVADTVTGTTADGKDVVAGDSVTTETTTPTVSTGGSTSSATYYTLTFDVQGGDAMSSIRQKKGTTATLATPTKTGDSFVEWNTNADGSGTSYVTNATVTFSASDTLYAIWSESNPEYSLDDTISNQPGVFNDLMKDTDGNVYAELTNWDAVANTIDVVIYDGDTTVGDVYGDIAEQVAAFLSNTTMTTHFATVTAKNNTNTASLTIGATIQASQLVDFVKTAFGIEMSGSTKIEALTTGENFATSTTITATVKNSTDTIDYTVNFSIADSEAVLDGAVTANVADLNDAMETENGDYAVLTEDVANDDNGGTIDVSILDGSVTVSTVATDIAGMLSDLLNNPVYSYHYTDLKIGANSIVASDASGLITAIQTALGGEITGSTTTADLIGKTIDVTATTKNPVETLTYSFKFTWDSENAETKITE